MAVLTFVLNLLNGKKTYIASFGFMAVAALKVSEGDYGNASILVLAAMATSSLRHALSKIGV